MFNTQIVILTNSIGGLISFRKELIEALMKYKYKVVIIAPEATEKKILEGKGIEVIPVKNLSRRGMNPLTDCKLFLEFLKLLKKINPSIVLTYTIKPNLYGGLACLLLKIPYIVNVTGLGTAVEEPGVLQKFTIFMYRLAMKKVSKIFFQNETNLEFFRNYRIGKVTTYYKLPGSGVNTKHYSYQPYPLENEPIRFIFISRLIKQKGIEEYLKVAEYFKTQSVPTEFHILGAPEKEYEEMVKQLNQLGTVKYHGRQPDVRPYLAYSHCLIHPSFYPEGMSNVVLESAASGRPVITTRRAGCKEGVEDNVTGFLVTPRNTKELIQTVHHFINLTYQQKVYMGKMGRKKIEREFKREFVVNAYIDTINKILGSKNRQR